MVDVKKQAFFRAVLDESYLSFSSWNSLSFNSYVCLELDLHLFVNLLGLGLRISNICELCF